jgi:hypothetical protein
MYHAHAAGAYRQATRMAHDGLERELMRMGMAGRARLLGVILRPGACYVIT